MSPKITKLHKSVGKKLKRRRKECGLTQEQLAERVKVSTVYIGYIEQGRYTPSLKLLDRIARELRDHT
jgi:transcriptional regulator with XRE-family HTH domain